MESDLSEVVPTEYRADLVVEQEELSTVLEVQSDINPRKRFTWPAYLGTLRARKERDVALLVVTLDPEVARWAAKPIPMGHPGWTLTPLVLGPDQIPVIDTLAAALASPELGVLSAMAHGQGPEGEQIGRAVIAATAGLDEDRAHLYADLTLLALNEVARRVLEELMDTHYEYKSDFARRYYGQGHREGREEGLKEGLKEGLVEGLKEGKRNFLLRLLELRFGPLPPVRHATLDAAGDATLDRWTDRVLTAATLDEVLGE